MSSDLKSVVRMDAGVQVRPGHHFSPPSYVTINTIKMHNSKNF